MIPAVFFVCLFYTQRYLRHNWDWHAKLSGLSRHLAVLAWTSRTRRARCLNRNRVWYGRVRSCLGVNWGERWRSKRGSCRFCFCSVCHGTCEGFLHNYVMGTLPHHNISLLFRKFPTRIIEMAPGATIPTKKSPNACRCIWSYSWMKKNISMIL